ncbi:MAG: TIGR03960 family B12-binding radical SAM protein [Elusimicrobiota bacterium]
MDIENLLPFVKKPAQYIGQEWNSKVRSQKSEVRSQIRFCLIFPDLYELGMSNLGIQILYSILNHHPDVICERAFAPMADMEALLRKEGLPLFSIETKTPLNQFDILGFSIQHELCYTNILNILNLSNIPVESENRNSQSSTYPLIIAGGPACVNPLPLSDFIDAFVIGDGENIITQIADYRLQIADKQELLKKLAEISSVYVPLLDNKEKIVKKNTVDLQTTQYPTEPVVPYLNITQNRLNVEIMRGCPRGCLFCQASKIYSPKRIRSKEKILEIIEKGLHRTGYDEISLLSLSSSDYPQINDLMDVVVKLCYQKKVAVALPSLNCQRSSLQLAEKTRIFKKTSLTFAIEAGTERLRKYIGKFVSDDEILATTGSACKAGWRLIKLYFMLGLPTETDTDIDGIVILVKNIKKQAPQLNLNITISPFVPKPHTAFEREQFFGIDYFNEKKNYLKKNLAANVKFHNPEMSLIEAVFARGDKKLNNLLKEAYKNGCKFDQWNEHFSAELWRSAFANVGINPLDYLKKTEKSVVLPWDFIKLS